MKKYTLLFFVITGVLLALSLSSCGKPEHTHRPSPWITDEQSTCTTFGYQHRECLDCGVIIEESEIYIYGDHVEMPARGYSSTCTSEGLTDGSYCAECGVPIVEQSRIPIIGHSYTLTSTVEPTCTTDGYKTYTCQCGYSYQELYAYALQHDGSVLDDYVPPTCTEVGYSMGYHCSRCGEVTVPQSVIEPLGHSTVTDHAVSAKCTESGLTEGSHCARCNLVFVPQTVIPPKGHTICIDEGAEPTCIWDGYTDSQFCTTCYKTVVEAVTIPATGHTYIRYDETVPTCYLGGYKTRTCHCGYSENYDEVGPLGHDEVIDPAIESTCTVSGRTEGSHCSRCNKVLKYYTVLPMLHHDITSVQVDPTLNSDGSITETCSHCDYVNVTPLVLQDYILPGNYYTSFIDHVDEQGRYHFVIPDIFEADGVWYKVVGMSERTFYRDYDVASVVFPDTITHIANGAFELCRFLTYVRLPANLQSIGDYAFYDCESLLNIDLPDSLASIGNFAFSQCARITEIHLGNSLTEVGEYAFSSCDSITSLTVPGSLRVISPYAFANLYGVNELTVCEGVEMIGEGAFCHLVDLTRLTLPDSVKHIGYGAFMQTTLISLELGDGDLIVDDEAFFNSDSLSVLIVGKGNKTFSPTAFTGCVFLRVIHDYSDNGITFDNPITQSVHVILRNGAKLFKDDGYEYTYTSDNFLFRYDGEKHQLIAYGGIDDVVTLPETIGGSAYDIHCMGGVLHAILPNNITEIPANAFRSYYGLRYVTIPSSVVEIGEYAFYETGLREIVIPDSVEVIGYYSFGECHKVKAITLSVGLRVIGERAFMETGNYDNVLVHVTIPDSVQTIGSMAFYNFESFGDLTVGKGLSSLGYCALGRPRTFTVSLENQYFKSVDGSLYSKDGKILYRYHSMEHANGEGFLIPYGVEIISAEAFYLSSVFYVEFPDTVTTIERLAFYGCHNLTRIKLGKGVTTVESEAFYRTRSVSEIIVNAGIKSIGANAFTTHSDNYVVYFEGNMGQWNNVEIEDKTIVKKDIYFYLERQSTVSGPYWHYDAEGNPVLW